MSLLTPNAAAASQLIMSVTSLWVTLRLREVVGLAIAYQTLRSIVPARLRSPCREDWGPLP
jgi:hypothetical protein